MSIDIPVMTDIRKDRQPVARKIVRKDSWLADPCRRPKVVNIPALNELIIVPSKNPPKGSLESFLVCCFDENVSLVAAFALVAIARRHPSPSMRRICFWSRRSYLFALALKLLISRITGHLPS